MGSGALVADPKPKALKEIISGISTVWPRTTSKANSCVVPPESVSGVAGHGNGGVQKSRDRLTLPDGFCNPNPAAFEKLMIDVAGVKWTSRGIGLLLESRIGGIANPGTISTFDVEMLQFE